MKKILIFFVAIIFTSCGLVKRVVVENYYEPTATIEIIQIGQTLPANITRIGSITIDGQNSLVSTIDECSYEQCMQELKSEAKKVGADIVYIVNIVAPNHGLVVMPVGTTLTYGVSGSDCYTIVADIYKKNTQH